VPYNFQRYLSEKVTEDNDKISIIFLKNKPDSKESKRLIFLSEKVTELVKEEIRRGISTQNLIIEINSVFCLQ
jgi:hypothetical protein